MLPVCRKHFCFRQSDELVREREREQEWCAQQSILKNYLSFPSLGISMANPVLTANDHRTPRSARVFLFFRAGPAKGMDEQ